MAVQDEVPKSRLTLRYKTEVNGTPADITLPLRLMVTGDFSGGTSKDAKLDLEERSLRNLDGTNTNDVMKDMGISLDFVVDNKVDPANSEEMNVHLDIDSMKAFEPDQIAKQIPKLEAIVTLKKVLEETLANVDNRKEFRKLLDDLMSRPDELESILAELKDFEGLRLPSQEKPTE
jgi:type VI secretion system protein ImpB